MNHSVLPHGLSEEALRTSGVSFFGLLPTAELPFSQEVRHICAGIRGQACPNYGKTWACPPGVGSPEDCRTQCLQFSSALVFTSVYELEDSFDFEGMQRGHREFKTVCDRLHRSLRQPALLLSNEGCIRCQTCTYPDAPCRFPNLLFPALEGYGILVTELAKRAGIPYHSGANTVSYFGLICYDRALEAASQSESTISC